MVYLLKCSDGTHYTGYSANLKQRLNSHLRGKVKYTSSRLPVQLITFITFSNKYKALAFEKYLKSGSGKAFANKRLL